MRALATLLLAAATLSTPALAQPATKPKPRTAPQAANPTRDAADAILAQLEETNDAAPALKAADALFESLIAYTPLTPKTDLTQLRTAAYTRQLVAHLSEVRAADRKAAVKLLRTNPRLAEALAWTLRPTDDDSAAAGILAKLNQRAPGTLDDFANLAAAIAVVYDKPVPKLAFEGKGKPFRLNTPDPVRVYEHFTTNHARLALPIKNVPPALLIYVVDLNEPASDWAWALDRYGNDRNYGRHYNDVHYDMDYLRPGTPKKWVKEGGWSLPNILKCGGVCEDRAYFTAGIAKANGVPAAYTTGQGSEVGHAWVGVLETSGRAAAWNFSHGRFGDYANLRGNVLDPQTGASLPDSTVSLLAESLTGDATALRDAQALTDAAEYLATLRGQLFTPTQPTIDKPLPTPRKADMDACLELLEAGLRRSPAFVPGWQLLAKLSEDERFTLDAKRRWSTVLDNLCGTKYPDFSLSILTPMIKSVPEHKDRNALWDWAAKQFTTRPDLVANVRFSQASEWEEAGDPGRAWFAYQDIVARSINAGPAAVAALQRSEKLLKDGSKDAQIPGMYADAWKKTQKPTESAPEFYRQSNWYRIGTLYARALTEAGDTRTADDVMGKLGIR